MDKSFTVDHLQVFLRGTFHNHLFIFVAIVFIGMNLVGCQNKTVKETNDVQTDSIAVEPETTYFHAIDRYLVNKIGTQYAQGEYCIPFHSIVGVDERNADDILVWGSYWLFHYNQVGDTLKTVSGGNHPGLMHIRQTENGFEVIGFDQVADGSDFLKSSKQLFGDKFAVFQASQGDDKKRERLRTDAIADYVKRNQLKVTMYQDEGWPVIVLP